MFNDCVSSFCEMEDDIFSEYISNVEVELRKNNKEYKNMLNEISTLMNKYPKLRDIYENDEATDLSKEECEALIKILNNQLELKIIGYKEMFYKGNAEAYFYFKKMRILKEDNEDDTK